MKDLLEKTSWMKYWLFVSGCLTLIAGLYFVLFPSMLSKLPGMRNINQPVIAISIGIITITAGISDLVSTQHPFKRWKLVLIALVGKMLFTGLAYYYVTPFSWDYQALVLANILIWLLPVAVILYGAFEFHRNSSEQLNYFYTPRVDLDKTPALTNKGASLTLLSAEHPVMLVFLRHLGCTFCKEALASIAQDRKTIAALGTQIVLVHMVDDESAEELTKQYGLNDLHRISDPNKKLYSAFSLEQGTWQQLFGLKVMVRGLIAGLLDGHRLGNIQGDYKQLPGVFLLYQGEIVKSYKHYSAADTPDYIYLANCEICF